MAEAFLSKRMLQLALLIRTIDDVMDQSEFQAEYRKYCMSLDSTSVYAKSGRWLGQGFSGMPIELADLRYWPALAGL